MSKWHVGGRQCSTFVVTFPRYLATEHTTGVKTDAQVALLMPVMSRGLRLGVGNSTLVNINLARGSFIAAVCCC